jgi:hypothetical protein
MSGSLASAKAKRAGIAPTPPPPPQQQQQQQIPPGARLSIPQVITMLDSRLVKLESATKSAVVTPVAAANEVPTKFMEDMESRFMMLAEEITTMKDVIMKLQAFTMDVNKTLFEERIQIMSEMDGGIKTQVVEESIRMEKISEADAEVTAI